MTREDIEQIVREYLSDLYTCGRVWEAWDYSTMTRDDFSLACEDDDIVSDFTNMIMEIISAQTKKIESALDKTCNLLGISGDEDLVADYCNAIRNSGADCWKEMLLKAQEEA